MLRLAPAVILVIMLVSCSFSSSFHPEQSRTSPQATSTYPILPIQTGAILTNTPQPLISSPSRTVVSTAISQNQIRITPTPEEAELYMRIPSHFTSFAEPRDSSRCDQADIPSQDPVFSYQLSLSTLKNMHYLSAENFQIIQLHDGYYIDPVLASSFTSPPAQDDAGTRLVEPVIRGDIDHDGGEDVVVLLQRRGGGSGTWRELAVILNHQPEPKSAATIYFGDRDVVRNVTIADGNITIIALIRQGGDSLCCPSLEIQKTFRLCQGNLVEIK